MGMGETDNGVDDNSNGLVDERVIVLKQYGTPSGGDNNGANVPNTGGIVINTVTHNVMKEFNDGSSTIPGFAISCKPDNAQVELQTKWKLEVSVAIEKVDYADTIEAGKRKTTRSYYKTATIALK
jgi:hypothetical protein